MENGVIEKLCSFKIHYNSLFGSHFFTISVKKTKKLQFCRFDQVFVWCVGFLKQKVVQDMHSLNKY